MKIVLLAGLIGIVMCADNDIQGPGNLVISGKQNSISGKENTIDGWQNVIRGNFNDIEGDKNEVKGNENSVDGNGNLVIGSGNLVFGEGNFVNDGSNGQMDMSWTKNLQTEFDRRQMPFNPLLQGMLATSLNQQMAAGTGNIDLQFAEKLRKQMEARIQNQGSKRNPALDRLGKLF